MVELTFFGGVNEIGGNKILLEDNGTRVFLDFGLSFRIRDMYYDEYLTARSFATIDEYVGFSQLPALKGLYREDHLRHANPNHELLGEKDERTAEAVVITHGHIDHIGLIPYLRQDIQLVGSEATRRYLQFIQDSKTGIDREYFHLYPAFERKPGTKTKVTRSDETRQERQYSVVKPNKACAIGCLEIEPYPVGHSLQGAYAYIIKTSSGNIAYTGDLRFHGPFQKESKNYLKALENTEIKVLLCEGTHIERPTEITESELQGRITNVVRDTKGLVLANYASYDACRVFTLAKAAAACGRKLLVNPKQAYYMSLIEGAPNTLVPPNAQVDVLMPRMGWGLWGDSRFDKDLWKSDYTWRFKDSIFERSDLLTPHDVTNAPTEYVVTCSFFELNLLHDLRPPAGSTYLWSSSMPFDEEGELDMKRVLNWLAHFGIGKPVELHCSGHMPGNDIHALIDAAQPELLVPIHTKEPKLFKNWHDDVRLMNYGNILHV